MSCRPVTALCILHIPIRSSYDGELDPTFDVPVKFSLAGTVQGFSTAVQHMVAGSTKTNGDIWRVYMPSNLGYGANDYSGVPAY